MIFGVQFLVDGVKRGEKVVYIFFVQDFEEVIKDYECFDLVVWNYVQKGNLILYDLGKEFWGLIVKLFQWSSVMFRIKDFVWESNIICFVIDLFMVIDFLIFDFVEKRVEFVMFFRIMSVFGIISFLIVELIDLDRYSEEYYFVDGVIMFYYYLEGNDMVRVIQVFKMRRIRYEIKMYCLEFGLKGFVVRGLVL